jgi:hypothetical protein
MTSDYPVGSRHPKSPTLLKNVQKRNDNCFNSAFAATLLQALRETFNTSLVTKWAGFIVKPKK